jgi:hypothetical protein
MLTGKDLRGYVWGMAEAKDLSEFVPQAKFTIKTLMANGKDEVAERIASKILESEGYLRPNPASVSLTKKVVMNLDGKLAASMVQKMSQVFGEGGSDVEEVHFEEEEKKEEPVVVQATVVEEKTEPAKQIEGPKKFINRLLEGESDAGAGSEAAVHAGASAEDAGAADDSKRNCKVGKKKSKKK